MEHHPPTQNIFQTHYQEPHPHHTSHPPQQQFIVSQQPRKMQPTTYQQSAPIANFQTTKTTTRQNSTAAQKQESETFTEKDQSFIIGVQAQNLYLMNYINKLEYLLEESVRDKKREKKYRQKQLTKIIKALSHKPNICTETSTLEYYLRITQGVDKAEVVDMESLDEDIESENLTKRLFSGKKDNQEQQDPLIQLLTPYNPSGVQGKQPEMDGFFKSEKDMKLDFKKKEQQIFEKYNQSKEKVDYVKKIEEVMERVKTKQKSGEKSKMIYDEGLDVREFLNKEWSKQAKMAADLVGNYKQ